ncbi:phosphopantetheine-containing protein [Rivularia sp. PCC 7116]|uniref:acyl carrier protein n=1 Tax=Rivularia sp. PCC 7116 TaxID=373994 RepID=UPI00029EDE41|nr:acyl carrier protein [Rivularia sp. PCC 7116]AFY54193.1 phosphopantetheine-containing protein [Rivularia sp. PCC 7116]
MEIKATQMHQLNTAYESQKENTQEDANHPKTAADIQEWLVSYLTVSLEIELENVDRTIPFEHYGLDSLKALALTGDLEDWLGYEVDPTLMYDSHTIETLAQHLVEEYE